MGRILVAAVLGLGLGFGVVGCTDENEDPYRILQLREGTFDEGHYRGMVREAMVEAPDAYAVICAELEDDSSRGIERLPTLSATVLSYSVTPAPLQEPDESDARRAIEVVRDECREHPRLD